MLNKPSISNAKDIKYILNNWRVISDKVTPLDIQVFRAIQDDISSTQDLKDILND